MFCGWETPTPGAALVVDAVLPPQHAGLDGLEPGFGIEQELGALHYPGARL